MEECGTGAKGSHPPLLGADDHLLQAASSKVLMDKTTSTLLW